MDIKNLLPTDQILTDKASLVEYGRDWTRYYEPTPTAILFPKSTNEIKKIIDWANQTKTKLVPSGGRTGLSGSAVAKNNEVVVNFSKMNKIIEFNKTDLTVTVQPGVVLEELQNFAKEKGCYFPVDFGARGSAQMGGVVATNAGGMNVVRYGLTRNWVTSMQVVTGKGEVLNINNSLTKNATGYDFRHLFIGSEGTLGMFGEITFKLTTPPKKSSLVLLGLDESKNVLDIFQNFRDKLLLNSFELFTHKCVEKVRAADPSLTNPFSTEYKYYLLIDCETPKEKDMDTLMQVFENCTENAWLNDGLISQSQAQTEQFWKYRDNITESISHYTPYKNDVSVKVSKVTEFMETTNKIFNAAYPDFEVLWFGHIGDGNLHVSILKPNDMPMNDFYSKCQEVDKKLFESIKDFRGSISAEHGVGLSKKPFLEYTRSKQEIQLMKEVKSIFDPNNILNPGKIF